MRLQSFDAMVRTLAERGDVEYYTGQYYVICEMIDGISTRDRDVDSLAL